MTWNDPQFKDNSNNPLTITCSHQSGTKFYWGTWNVHCTAFDNNPNNNPAVCQFTLKVERKCQKTLLENKLLDVSVKAGRHFFPVSGPKSRIIVKTKNEPNISPS